MAVRATSATTVANTALTITLGAHYDRLRIWNRGSAELFVRLDGTTAVVGADENYVIPAGKDDVFFNIANAAQNQSGPGALLTSTSVSVISTAACPVTIAGN